MTLKEFIIQMGFQIDEDSERQAEEGINAFKDFADQTLGDIGISLSMDDMDGLIEQWNQASDVVQAFNEGLIGTLDAQSAISDAATALAAAYTAISDAVESIDSTGLFDTEGANEYISALKQVVQLTDATASALDDLGDAINDAFAQSAVTDYADSLMLSEEAQDALAKAVGETIQALAEELSALDEKANKEQFGQEALNAATESSLVFAQAKGEETSAINESADASHSDALAKYAEAKGTDAAAESTGAFATAIRGLLRQAQNIVPIMEDITETAEALFDFTNGGYSGDAFNGMESGATSLQEALNGLYGTAEEVYGAVMPLMQELGESLDTTALNDSIMSVSSTIESLADAWSTAMQGMGEAGDEMLKGFMSGFNEIYDSIVKASPVTIPLTNEPEHAESHTEPSCEPFGDTPNNYTTPAETSPTAAPESQIESPNGDELLEAVKMLMGAASVAQSDINTPMSTLNNQVSNLTVNQSVTINNTFNGPKELQKEASKAMDDAEEDIAESLAKAIAYSR